MTDELLYRYFNDEATVAEIRQIETWLSEDPSRQREYDAAHMLFNAMVLNGEEYPAKAARKTGKVRTWVRTVMRIAAVLALVIGAGYAGREVMYRELSAKNNVVEVPVGQRMSLTLSDGTEICLNGGSKLEYPVVFDRRCRKVSLSGEAFLTVSHDESHPFVVETFASRIEVLGTEFNVYADEEEGDFSATLLRGKVRVSTLGDEYDQVTLSPDERVEFIDNHLVVSHVSAADYVSWTYGYISLGGVDFEELMHRFENAYGVNIVIDRKESVEVGYQSGKIRVSEGIDFALHILQEACDFSYEKDIATNTITIR